MTITKDTAKKNHTTFKPFFSIVIPTLNEEKALPLLLKDLSKQNHQNFEVIHVDGRSDDKTVEKANKFALKLDLNTINALQRNVSFQRNLGAKNAKGQWIIFMDADVRLSSNYLEDIQQQLNNNPTVEAFTCWLDTSLYPIKYKPTIQLINLGLFVLNSEALGAMIGVRRTLFMQFPFNEEQSFCEDVALIKQLVKAEHIFQCFTHPRFYYSMRRFEKEGLINLTKIVIEGRLRLLLDGGAKKYKKYPMLGGSYYEANDIGRSKLISILLKVDRYLQNISYKQFEKVRSVWTRLTKEMMEEQP